MSIYNPDVTGNIFENTCNNSDKKESYVQINTDDFKNVNFFIFYDKLYQIFSYVGLIAILVNIVLYYLIDSIDDISIFSGIVMLILIWGMSIIGFMGLGMLFKYSLDTYNIIEKINIYDVPSLPGNCNVSLGITPKKGVLLAEITGDKNNFIKIVSCCLLVVLLIELIIISFVIKELISNDD